MEVAHIIVSLSPKSW